MDDVPLELGSIGETPLKGREGSDGNRSSGAIDQEMSS